MAISEPGSLDGNARPSRNHVRTPTRLARTERRAGRRAISVALLPIGILALVSGFWSLFLPPGSLCMLAHIVSGSLVGVLSLLHVRYNRNALRLYFHDLGWPPAVLRLGIAAAISLLLLVPVMRLA
jgi:hypothetical protein